MSLTIQTVQAWEILDSRGNPTIEAFLSLSDGSHATAQVPSGASTGKHEAVELRDQDPARYQGKGVTKAIANINGPIAMALSGKKGIQSEADRLMIELDGSMNKSNLGANAILGVSCALARALAHAVGLPLWQFLTATKAAPKLPVPMVNILSGGLHAGGQIEFQDFLIIPHGFDTFAQALEATVAIHAATAATIQEAGYLMTGVADEGGWGPRFESNEAALKLLTQSIERAGFRPGEQVSIAIDAAATHFHKDGMYHLSSEKRVLNSEQMADLLKQWVHRYPIVSIEDGLAEDDWDGWQSLTTRLADSINLVGDDLFTTNPTRLRRGIEQKAANAVLVKMNQIGTLTETFEVLEIAAAHNYAAVVSARSGETEDSFLADLAVASGAGQIKIGSISRSERLSKYNRLLRIERESGLAYPGRQFLKTIGTRPANIGATTQSL